MDLNISTAIDAVKHDGSQYSPGTQTEVRKRPKVASCTIDQCRVKASHVFGMALSAVGLTRQSAADAAGVSRAMVDRWEAVDIPVTMPIGRLLVMATTSKRGREAARIILTALLTHVDVPDSGQSRGNLREGVDELHAEVGGFATAWRKAMSDGLVTPSEAPGLIGEVCDVERACVRIRAEAGRIACGEVRG